MTGREEKSRSPSLLMKIDVTTRSNEKLYDGSMPVLGCELEGQRGVKPFLL